MVTAGKQPSDVVFLSMEYSSMLQYRFNATEFFRRKTPVLKHHQIVVVTHLPQVAAFADKHLKVEKSASGNVTTSSVTELDQKARVTEIARMMAGIEDSTSALEHARELLEMSNSKSL